MEPEIGMTVVAATQNQHKIQEIEAITRPLGIQVKSLGEMGLSHIQVIEDGDTFEANSLKKALEIHRACGHPALADDSGLMVDALSGAPGVFSARFAGEDADDQRNNEKLLDLMKEIPWEKRGARFVSVITMVFPGEEILVARGECPGRLLFERKGNGGFGYDPLFLPLGFDLSFGEMKAEEKNRISHRAKALAVLADRLRERGGI